jgi:hypothetical protein
MDYRHAPHLRPVMNARRRRRTVRRKGIGGWYTLPASSKWDVGERVEFRRTHRRKKLPAHRHLNPFRRNPGGGIGIGTMLLIGGAALLFFKPDLLSGLFGGSGVPSGFTQVANGLYRGPDGAIYARNPSTGQMVKAPLGTTPTSATDLLTRAGVSLVPAATSALASWVSGLFSGGSPTSASTPRVSSQGGSGSGGSGTSSFPTGAIGAALPVLPAITSIWSGMNFGVGADAELPPLDAAPSLWEGGDLFGESDLFGGETWGSDLTFGDDLGFEAPSMFELNTDDWLTGYDWGGLDSGFDTLPVTDAWDFDWGDPLVADASFDWGFMGLGRRGFRRSRGYAKFGRRPASTR